MVQLFQHAQNNDLTTKMTLSIIQIENMHAIKNQAKLYNHSVTNFSNNLIGILFSINCRNTKPLT